MIVQPCQHAHEVETKIWYTDRFIYVTKNHCFINLLMKQHFVLIKFIFWEDEVFVFLII